MNAIVAIGGAALFRVVDEYRAAVPSIVWVLGTERMNNPKDLLLRSFESLLDPSMLAYFETAAQATTEEVTGRLALAGAEANIRPEDLAESVVATLALDLAKAMALVTMLDRAHATVPVELVLIDDCEGVARSAVAWARSRGLPVVTVPEKVPLRHPPSIDALRTVVLGERARTAYRAMGVDEALLEVVTLPQPRRALSTEKLASQQRKFKETLTRGLAWGLTDVVVVFAPASHFRDSALESARAFSESLAAVVEGFLAARKSVPTLRLAVVTESLPPVVTRAVEATATAAGFASISENGADWFAGADIVISIESSRSIDAAAAGIPSVNLWQPENWYLGPAFAAEDGVIDVPLETLSATLVALAGNAQLRSQIAAIADHRIGGDSPSSAPAVRATARELVRRRVPNKATSRKKKPDIMIYAPDYLHASAGLRALYRLCHLINLAGGEASMYPGKHVHPSWNTPPRVTPVTDETIVVYPEIYHLKIPPKRVVRWVLNTPGLLLNSPKTYRSAEMVFYYSPNFRSAAQEATKENLTDERELHVYTIEPELFFNDRSTVRSYDCVFIGKGRAVYDRVQPRAIRDAFVIGSIPPWPATRTETAELLRGCLRLFSFDAVSAMDDEALICGAQLLRVNDDGEYVEISFDTSDYIRQYYDLSQVERFLRLIGDRWN